MKKISLYSLFVLIAVFAFQSCDKIEEKDFAKYEGVAVPEGAKRVVLLEDYTGHKCVNCPTAGLAAKNLLDKDKGGFPENLIVMTVHAGYFSTPDAGTDYDYDFTTETGTQWFENFNLQVTPTGMVNRVPNSEGKIPLLVSEWNEAILNEIAKPQLIDVNINAEYDADNKSVKAKVNALFLSAIDDNLAVNLVLVEDSIIKPQKNSNPDIGGADIFDYVHMHVFREALTKDKVWGDVIGSNFEEAAEFSSEEYTLSFEGTDYAPEHCGLIAFISKKDTKEVIQAAKIHLIEE